MKRSRWIRTRETELLAAWPAPSSEKFARPARNLLNALAFARGPRVFTQRDQTIAREWSWLNREEDEEKREREIERASISIQLVYTRSSASRSRNAGQAEKRKKPRDRSISQKLRRRRKPLLERKRKEARQGWAAFHGVAREQSPRTGDQKGNGGEKLWTDDDSSTVAGSLSSRHPAFHHGNVMENNERNGPR